MNGEGPSLGRVTRLREVEHRTGQLRIRRRSPRPPTGQKPQVLLWSGVLALVTLLVIGLALVFWLEPYLSKRPVKFAETSFPDDSQARVVSQFPSPSREQALERVRLALANRDPDKVESYFRPGSATCAEILDFVSSAEQRDGLVERYDWLSSLDVGGLLIEGVLVVSEGKDKPVERLAFLTPDSAGNWKLDFDAYARTAIPSWQDLEKGAEQAIVRIFLAPDSYFNGPFSDDKQWNCYAIASADSEDLLRGYCKVGSAQATALQRLFSEGRTLSRATVEIRRVAGGDPRQFEITQLLAPDWVLP